MSDATAYREPGVKLTIVEEGFSNEEPKIGLPPLFIGPCFQIQDKVAIGTYSKTAGLAASYDGLEAGSKVDITSGRLFVIHGDTGIEHEITDGGNGASVPVFSASGFTAAAGIYKDTMTGLTGRRASDGLTLSDAAKGFTDNIQQNDKLVMTDNGNETVLVNEVDASGDLDLFTALTGESILHYDTLVTSFTVGATLSTGAVSAPILAVYEDGTTGYLILGTIAGGAFADGDALVDDGAIPGAATANGLSAQAGTDSYLDFTGLTAPGDIALGDIVHGEIVADQILNGDFTTNLNDWTAGAGWTWIAGVADKAVGVGNTLEQAVSTFVTGKSYRLTVDITMTAGINIVIEAGGVTLGTVVVSGSYEYNFIATSAGALTFTPDGTFAGTVDNVIAGETPSGEVLYLEEQTTTTGYLLLSDVIGTFVDGEDLTVDSVKKAESDGTQSLFSINVDRAYTVRRELQGLAYYSIRALRTSYTNQMLYLPAGSRPAVVEFAGDEDSLTFDNPLGKVAELSASIGSDCYVIMVDDLPGALDPKNVTLSAWQTAFDLAKDYMNPFAYAPLIQNDAILSLMEIHINWKRDPDNFMREVAGYYCPARVTEDIAVDTRDATIGFSSATEFEDFGISSFVSYGCLVGRTLEITGTDGTVYKYKALTVADNKITLTAAVPVAVQAFTEYRYINEYFTLGGEAAYDRMFGQAYQNKALRIIHPYTWQIENQEVPGYFYAAVKCAQININEPHHIYTGEKVPLFTKAYTPFTKREHLNEVASGGIQVFVALSSNTVKCRDAITTDRTLPAREEEHVVNSIDFAARYIRAVFLPHQGRVYIDEMLDDGIALLAGGCESYLVQKKKILGRLTLLKYVVDEDDPRLINYEFAALPRFSNKWSDIILRVVSK